MMEVLKKGLRTLKILLNEYILGYSREKWPRLKKLKKLKKNNKNELLFIL
jgi:hypothetical protein